MSTTGPRMRLRPMRWRPRRLESGIWRNVFQVKAQRIGSKERGDKGWPIGNAIPYLDVEADIRVSPLSIVLNTLVDYHQTALQAHHLGQPHEKLYSDAHFQVSSSQGPMF